MIVWNKNHETRPDGKRQQPTMRMTQLFLQESEGKKNLTAYNFRKPQQRGSSPEFQLIKALSGTRAFKRLNDITFLGALDYALVPYNRENKRNARFTRAQHSVGVAELARFYLDLKTLKPQRRLVCVAAAMLHDIGHSPFSHTLEPVFKENFGIDHHIATENIISGVVLGTSVRDTLDSFGITPKEILDVLNDHDEDFDRFFSGPINFDTIEGILRSRSYFKMSDFGLSPMRVVEAATIRKDKAHEGTVDAFWRAKHDVYNLMIRSPAGVLCDKIFQEVARKYLTRLSASDFYLTETMAFEKMPSLLHLIDNNESFEFLLENLPKHFSYQSRNFFVAREASFFDRVDKKRYQQTKTHESLTLD